MKKLREYSIPLIVGIIASMLCANLAPEWYHNIIETPIFGEKFTLHWFVNDIFMSLFFASAGIEIVNSLSKGGPLNPVGKAITPLMATVGGVLGPVLVFFLLNGLVGQENWTNGWGIVTATDIALAWFVAKIVFGKTHPAIIFLLLLAIADDAVGLVIIAVFYPDPIKGVVPIWLLLIVVAMIIAFIFNKKEVNNFWPYLLICGPISWIGASFAGVHPALSMVAIVPFIPRGVNVTDHVDYHGLADAHRNSPLHKFEQFLSPIVDYGLFFFGFANAGVKMSQMSTLTWIVLGSLIIGKMLGISLFTFIATKVMKFDLPKGMAGVDVVIVSAIAGIGLTVSLFIAQAAYEDIAIQGAAKMGAVFSVASALIAFIIRFFKKKKGKIGKE